MAKICANCRACNRDDGQVCEERRHITIVGVDLVPKRCRRALVPSSRTSSSLPPNLPVRPTLGEANPYPICNASRPKLVA